MAKVSGTSLILTTYIWSEEVTKTSSWTKKGKKGKVYSKSNPDIKTSFLPEEIDEKSMFLNILFNT